MADDIPTLIQPIPPQTINEGANFGPFNLKEFIDAPAGTRFFAENADGSSLSSGIICTSDGIISGIPATGTQGVYQITVTAEYDPENPFTTTFELTIKERHSYTERSEKLSTRKNQVWQSLLEGFELPELSDLMSLPITKEDIQYLLERYASFTIWDVFNLEPPGIKQLLELPGQSPHFNVYDCGSCLVGAPKELYSEERTIEDTLQTARAMGKEVVQRGWTVELAGMDRVMRAAWMEIAQLGELTGKKLHIVSYQPSERDIEVLNMILEERKKQMLGTKPTS